MDNEFADIQGLLWSGYGPLKQACYLLLRISDAAAARPWLADMVDSVTTIEQLQRQRLDRTMHIALTADGMRALGVEANVVDEFAPEFVAGMAGDAARSRRLGDVGADAPANWRWGDAETPHLLLMLYAAGDIDAWRAELEAAFPPGMTTLQRLDTANMDGREPFGFIDGVSQPRIDWSGDRDTHDAGDDYENLLSVGEFLLGYPNEYRLYTDRPLLDPAAPGAASLPMAEDAPDRRDLGRNGSYLVLRELAQDVRGFWRFIAAHAEDETARLALAQAIVGRQMTGAPLLPLRQQPIRGVGPDQLDIERNQFTYDADPAGLRCPFGAHVRRANPRTPDMPHGQHGVLARLIRMLGFGRQDLDQDLVAASRFHRILRRGREFGGKLDWRQATEPGAADPQSGLHFICLNANIARQFEFIQNAWLVSAKFDGMSGEADPLLGNRLPMLADHPTDGFTLPQPNGISRRIDALPRFITVRGGAYFFLPGIRALRYFAGG